MGVNVFSRPAKLAEGQSLDGFSCGAELIDTWVEKYASRAEGQGTAVPYVSFAGEVPAGFYTLSPFSIVRNEVAGGWIRRNVPEQIPVFLLGMLAVDKRFQGQGLGTQLLKDAVLRTLSAAEIVSGRALVVEPADEQATKFYKHYGFAAIEGTPFLFVRLV